MALTPRALPPSDYQKTLTLIGLSVNPDDIGMAYCGNLTIKKVDLGNRSYDLFYQYNKLIEIIEYTN